MPDDYNTSDFYRCPHDRENPYAQINREFIRNEKIKPESRWLLIYLLSHKDGYTIRIPEIIKNQKISKDRIYRMINDLLDAGYMKREKYIQNGLQRFKYCISEFPKFKKCLPCPDFPDMGNQDTKKEQVLRKRKERKESSSSTEVEEIKPREQAPSACVSPEVRLLSEGFSSKIKELNPKLNSPARINPDLEMQTILNSGRSCEDIFKLLDWIFSHKYWKNKILNAKTLRLKFEVLWTEAFSLPPKRNENPNIAINTGVIEKFKQSQPQLAKNLYIFRKTNHAIDTSVGLDVYLGIPPDDFKRVCLRCYKSRT